MTSLQSLHTFGFSTSALKVTRLNSVTDIKELLPLKSPFYILGGGSNSIFVEDFNGEIARVELQGIKYDENQNQYLITAQAGEDWHEFVVSCLKRGIYGLENLALIPGTIGAAPIQNIGAYGREVGSFIESVNYIELATGIEKQILHTDCAFSYRDSVFKHELSGKVIITAVNFAIPKRWIAEQSYGELAKLENPSAQDIFNSVVNIRRAKLPDPDQIGNAGSFFKNPVVNNVLLGRLRDKWPMLPAYQVSDNESKIPAAWLIDRLGYKGQQLGGIICHPTQPLVLANTGSGTGEALLHLARQIKKDVWDTFAIELENEVRLIAKSGVINL